MGAKIVTIVTATAILIELPFHSDLSHDFSHINDNLASLTFEHINFRHLCVIIERMYPSLIFGDTIGSPKLLEAKHPDNTSDRCLSLSDFSCCSISLHWKVLHLEHDGCRVLDFLQNNFNLVGILNFPVNLP